MTGAIHTLPGGRTQTNSLWAAVTVLGVAVVALGASLVYIQHRPPDGHAALAALDAAALSAPAEPSTPLNAPLPVTTVANDEVVVTQPASRPALSELQPVAPRSEAAVPPSATPAPAPAMQNSVPPVVVATTRAPQPLPAPVVITETGPVAGQAIIITPAQRASCAGCGRVEAVTSIERKGTSQGVGAVAGGVLGAVVGNQIGKGSGRAIATIIGAVGGGVAGNAIEKNATKETVYQVLVRMDDGSLRSVEQGTTPVIGAAVVVDGNTLRLRPAETGADGMTAAPGPVVPQAKVYSTDRL
jgi:outer membrane lipoprotein SlyB